MELEKAENKNPRIIEDDSSWSFLSESEKEEDPSPALNKIPELKENHLFPESENERMSKFNLTYENLLSIKKIGTLKNKSKKHLLVESLKNHILKLDNILLYRKNQEVKILGKIKDIIGSIEEPFYVVDFDNYLKNYEEDLIINLDIFICESHMKIFNKNELQQMLYEKHFDESEKDDQDLEQDFSDDEKESIYKKFNKKSVLKKRSLIENKSSDLDLIKKMLDNNRNSTIKKLSPKNEVFTSNNQRNNFYHQKNLNQMNPNFSFKNPPMNNKYDFNLDEINLDHNEQLLSKNNMPNKNSLTFHKNLHNMENNFSNSYVPSQNTNVNLSTFPENYQNPYYHYTQNINQFQNQNFHNLERNHYQHSFDQNFNNNNHYFMQNNRFESDQQRNFYNAQMNGNLNNPGDKFHQNLYQNYFKDKPENFENEKKNN